MRSGAVTSHGTTVPSMTPLESASAIAVTGMPTGVAPKVSSSLLTMREGPRSLRPFMSSSLRTPLPLAWITPGPWVLMLMTLTSLNSSLRCLS